MKYLGSAAFGFRGAVSSVRQGLVLLGKEQTRRWVSLIALGEMGRNKPEEVLVNAALRAKLCELIGEDAGMADRKPDLFLLGALSLIDTMLDQPMSDVLAELPLADDLSSALGGGTSALRPVLEFVLSYERGDWEGCAAHCRTLGVAETLVFQRYREAASWAAQALKG
jgi:c-di-GMP-related signal transduction protein